MHSTFIMLSLLLITASINIVTADVYRYRDGDSVIHYSNKPNSSRYRLFRKSSKVDRGQKARRYKIRNVQKAPLTSNRKVVSPLFTKAPQLPDIAQPIRNRTAKRRPAHERTYARVQQITGQKRPDKRTSNRRPEVKFSAIIDQAAKRFNLPPELLEAMIKVESNYNPRAVSVKGAAGLMQIMPMNYPALKIDNPFDPRQNINGGAQYLKQMLDQFNGNIVLALAAYNAGPSPVERHGYHLPYRETRKYVRKVLQYYDKYKTQQRAQI